MQGTLVVSRSETELIAYNLDRYSKVQVLHKWNIGKPEKIIVSIRFERLDGSGDEQSIAQMDEESLKELVRGLRNFFSDCQISYFGITEGGTTWTSEYLPPAEGSVL